MAHATVILAAVACGLLVGPTLSRHSHPVDLSPQVPGIALATEVAADPEDTAITKLSADPEVKDLTMTSLALPDTAVAGVPVGQRPSLSSTVLCLVFRCGGEAAAADPSSEVPSPSAVWARPTEKAEVEDEESGEMVEGGQEQDAKGVYDSDSDFDSDSDSDSDDEDDEAGIIVWFWRWVHRF